MQYSHFRAPALNIIPGYFCEIKMNCEMNIIASRLYLVNIYEGHSLTGVMSRQWIFDEPSNINMRRACAYMRGCLQYHACRQRTNWIVDYQLVIAAMENWLSRLLLQDVNFNAMPVKWTCQYVAVAFVNYPKNTMNGEFSLCYFISVSKISLCDQISIKWTMKSIGFSLSGVQIWGYQ